MATQAERTTATRAAIIAEARRRFLADGVAATPVENIHAAAGVSRGALYHHFPSKAALVEAVYDVVSRDLVRGAARRARAQPGSPLDALVEGGLAWLRATRQPGVARFLLQDGPGALGVARCREIEERHSLGRMTAAVRAASAAGEIRVASPDLTARLLNAALSELAVVQAAAVRRSTGSGTAADSEVEGAFRELAGGLRVARRRRAGRSPNMRAGGAS